MSRAYSNSIKLHRQSDGGQFSRIPADGLNYDDIVLKLRKYLDTKV